MGRETAYEYDDNGFDLLSIRQKNGDNFDLLHTRSYTSPTLAETVTDESGQTYAFTYNSAGQVLTATVPERQGISEERERSFTYDEDGYLVEYSGTLGQKITRTYDAFGRIRTVTSPVGHTLTMDYDDLDRLTRVTYPDTSAEEIVYNRLDITAVRDRLGRWSRTVFDAMRRPTSVQDALGGVASYSWCKCGSLDRLTDAGGNSIELARDSQGRVIKEIRADSTFKEIEYEATTSRLKEVVDPKGQEIQYTYYRDDNLKTTAYENEEFSTPNVSFTYDGVYDRVTSMSDGEGVTTFTYNDITAPPELGAGKLVGVDGPLTNDAVAYQYDEHGRVVARTVASRTTTWNYDEAGRLITQNTPVGTFMYEYSGPTNLIKSITYPSGQIAKRAYDSASGDFRLVEIHNMAPSGDTLSKFTYEYDAVGNITKWTQELAGQTTKVYDLRYDASDQLTVATVSTGGQTPTIVRRHAYGYDSARNLEVEQTDDSVLTGSLNSLNQITNRQPGGELRFLGSLSEAGSVTVDNRDAIVSASGEFEGSAPVSVGSNEVTVAAADPSSNLRTNVYSVDVSGSARTLAYDDNGNLISDGTRTLEWDAENRLIRVLDNESELVSFAYDGLGRRVQKVSGGVARSYVYDGADVIEERSSMGVKRYVQGPLVDQPLAVDDAGSISFYAADHLGSIVQQTHTSGAVELTREYDPYGNMLAGESVSGYSFTGREWDAEVELYYYRARYYDPSVARFLSEDPLRSTVSTAVFSQREPRFHYRSITGSAPSSVLDIQQPAGTAGTPWRNLSPYAYAENNPVKFIDPSGYAACSSLAWDNFMHCVVWSVIIVVIPPAVMTATICTIAGGLAGLMGCALPIEDLAAMQLNVTLWACGFFALASWAICKWCDFPPPKLPPPSVLIH